MPPTALRRIAILPDARANQIAAGEVVERPASVVKELAENSLDAGARHLRIELEQGGKTLIAVSDDGAGMGREDAVLSLDRHATSKIASAADLVGVRTFGFRGEALPAIASVSRFTLLTSDGGDAVELTVTGGRLARRGPAPAVGFELVVEGPPRLVVPPDQDAAARLAGVWGAHLAGTLVAVDYALGPLRVTGFTQRPGDAAPTGRRAQLFVNGRPFRDNFLVRAAEAGYRSAIHPGDRPSMLFRLELDPGDVDVNVHPAKLEVRFRDRLSVERVVVEAVRHALGGLEAAAPVGEWRPFPRAAPPAGPVPESLFTPPEPGSHSGEAAPAERSPGESFGAPVVQLFSSYIAFEGPEGLVIVDQHSAHERVLYEEVMEVLAGGGGGSQRLLLPETIELTDEELDALERHRDAIEAVGFQVEPFGGRSVVVQAVPAPHPRFDAIACFRELVPALARGRFGGWATRRERFGAPFACRAAVKAGMPLTEPEMRALLIRLFATRLPPHDVHGRSTIVQLPRDELERRFGRR